MPTPGVTENVNKTLILRAGNCLWGKHLDKLLGETHESGYDKTQEGFVWGWDFLKGRIRSEVEGEEEAGEKASKMEKASMESIPALPLNRRTRPWNHTSTPNRAVMKNSPPVR